MFELIGKLIIKPFYSRLFWIIFPVIFIPFSTFGIHYKYFDSSYTGTFLGLFTPEAIITYTIPLLVSIVIDGAISMFDGMKTLNRDDAEFQLYRDSSIFAVVSLIITILFMYFSFSKSSVFLGCLSIIILWIYWIILSGSKREFEPTKSWSAIGDKDDSSAGAITNG